MNQNYIYQKLNFNETYFQNLSHVNIAVVLQDGVVPDDFYATTNFPTYIHSPNGWVLVQNQRMDAVVISCDLQTFECLEARNVKVGDRVVTGFSDDGSEGVFAHHDGFVLETDSFDSHQEIFSFMSAGHSREKAVNYDLLAKIILKHKQENGHIIWVCGPALVHSNSQNEFEWLIRNGFVQTMFAGNAVATHDLERAMLGTSLGVNMQGRGVKNGHRNHLQIINRVRKSGSITQFIQDHNIQTGIMAALTHHNIDYILAGSIRDDGPLPGVITDSLQAQAEMRTYTQKSTLVIMLASALHSIATGNMLPTFYEKDGEIHPLQTIVVDQDEFVLHKLADRGSHQAFGVARNVADFLSQITHRLETMVKERPE
jgi:lysine-ketoglutarate reductase/saccharopine dehydrogenase-like protein (TIGR00300 family)